MKTLLLIVLISSLYFTTFAQNESFNTSVQTNISTMSIKGTDHQFKDLYNFFDIGQAGISLNRYISNDFYVQVSYQRWVYNGRQLESMLGPVYKLPILPSSNGKPEILFGYQAIDASAIYRVSHKRHTVYGGGGLSFAWGKVSYRVDYWQVPGYGDVHIMISDFFRIHHWGGNILAGYDYSLFKDRANIGISGKMRNMTGDFRQYEVSLNAGYHFNCLKAGKKDKSTD